jgi:hypothetical protein
MEGDERGGARYGTAPVPNRVGKIVRRFSNKCKQKQEDWEYKHPNLSNPDHRLPDGVDQTVAKKL